MKIFHPTILHIIYSWRCNLKCRHCHNDSGADKTDKLETENLIALLPSAAAAGITHVALLGGEIFLYPEVIEEMIKESHRNNLSVGIVSNGYWGKSIESARSTINLLKRSGWDPKIDSLLCSVGDYHQEWLPISSVKTAITEYYSAFNYPVKLQVESVTTDLDTFRTFFADIEPASFLIVRELDSLYRFGREEPLEVSADKMKFYKDIRGCGYFEWLEIIPTGSLFPCPGFNDNNPTLSFGNLNTMTDATEMIKKANESFIIKLLMNTELRTIYSTILSTHPELPKFFSHRCEICEIICNEKYRDELITAFPNILG